MNKFCSAETAVATIKSGQTVASVGVIGWITPDLVLKSLAARFQREGSPRDLTFYFPCGTGDGVGIRGMDHVAIEGLMKRIVSGSYINPVIPRPASGPELMRLIRENAIEAYSWPIGASMHWLREVARRSPGYMTEIGLGCYIDPRPDRRPADRARDRQTWSKRFSFAASRICSIRPGRSTSPSSAPARPTMPATCRSRARR